ncbi:MAG: Bax inhibitor-1 family protein [Gammaproteobacteria bacterium]|nr:Bax inhibitor-1 family protein [Gammaproteobacteria bacterium]
MQSARIAIRSPAQAIEVNSVLRSTYLLLSATIGFSAVCATVAIYARLPFMNPLLYFAGIIGLSIVVHMTARSVWGLFWTFVYTGFLGVALGPIVSIYLSINPMIVAQALALTAATFVGLSLYTIVRRTDFSWLGQFITVSIVVIVGIIIMSFFVNLTPFALMISGFMVIVACAMILWQTSQIVLGGERNYIIATVTLFTSIYILFINLLQIIGIFGGDD